MKTYRYERHQFRVNSEGYPRAIGLRTLEAVNPPDIGDYGQIKASGREDAISKIISATPGGDRRIRSIAVIADGGKNRKWSMWWNPEVVKNFPARVWA